MTRRSTLWWLAAGVYAFINVGGLIIAAAEGEQMHAMVHATLLLLGVAGYVGWRLARRAPAQDVARAQVGEARLEYLQQSVDAMALEVERIGEAQRFGDKLKVERGETPPPKNPPPEA
jgi:hypothetical protein